MLLLALDTTTPDGSCAIARDGALLHEEVATGANGVYGARLPGDLVRVLAIAGVHLREVDVFAVATGPGSFTGLRVGIAAMQGLAFGTGRPLIGISALDALAEIAARYAWGTASVTDPVTKPGGETDSLPRIATWIDAWRGDVYAALYHRGREALPPVVARPDDVLATLAGAPTIFMGNGADTYRDLIRSALGADGMIAEHPVPSLAGTIAAMATEKARAGHVPPPSAIGPLYVRRPDAERAKDPAVRSDHAPRDVQTRSRPGRRNA